MTTQHDKIRELCSDGEFHCQNEFRALYIFSPHKRREEIEIKDKKVFIRRKCIHGHSLQFDYKMVDKEPSPVLQEVREILKKHQEENPLSRQIKLI